MKIFKKCFSATLNTKIKDFNKIYVELRSDVKTLPTEDMIEFLKTKNFGDDSFNEDPSIQDLEHEMNLLFGTKACVFLPSGTMANMTGLSLGCVDKDVDRVIIGDRSHIAKMEQGAMSNIGVKCVLVKNIEDGRFDEGDFEKVVERIMKSGEDMGKEKRERIRVIALENSHNYNGGAVLPIGYENELRKTVERLGVDGVKFHLDGSRVMPVAAVKNIDLRSITIGYDSINVCLSKCLGGPMGSVLLLNKAEDIDRAYHIRKILGGSLRQSGIAAAMALYQLKGWKERFIQDHNNALALATALSEIRGIITHPTQVQTNIVLIYLENPSLIPQVLESLRNDHKVLLYAFDNNTCMRAVTHYQVTPSQINHTINAFKSVMSKFNL